VSARQAEAKKIGKISGFTQDCKEICKSAKIKKSPGTRLKPIKRVPGTRLSVAHLLMPHFKQMA